MAEFAGMNAETERGIEITRISLGTYEATNRRGGILRFGSGDDDSFSPVELLLAAVAGCTAADIDFITAKRAEPGQFNAKVTADKLRDAGGNHLANITLTFDITFPEGEGGDAARNVLPEALKRSHDRLCTVSRTIELGTPIEARLA